MKRTDYAKIAPRYDENEVRLRIPQDEILSEHLGRVARRPFAVLDLACGSGNYLAAQNKAFREQDVRWYGLDASEDMLALARSKNPDVELHRGRAESLPFEAGQFDYVTTSFAFHHFEEKSTVLDEVSRVLREDGVLRVVNIAPAMMRRWWVYQFFPDAFHEDEKRFWSHALLCYELSCRGFEPRARIEYDLYRIPLTEVLADVERRDMSQFSILTEAQYGRGLARVREAVAADPQGYVDTEIAVLGCTALRGSTRG